MTTEKQIEANRANAMKSTGPTSSEGKARSSRNAVKHGLTAAAIVLPGENKLEYEELRNETYAALMPETAIETRLVDQIVSIIWRQERVPMFEANLIGREEFGASIAARKAAAGETITALILDASSDKLVRYESSLARNLSAVFRQLRDLQSHRLERERETKGGL